MRRGLRAHTFWYIVADLAWIVLWRLPTPDHFFWPPWSIVGWGVGPAIRVWAVRSASRSAVGS